MSVTNEGIGSTVNYKLRRKRGAGGREGEQRAIDKPFIRRVGCPPPTTDFPLFLSGCLCISRGRASCTHEIELSLRGIAASTLFPKGEFNLARN